MKKKASPLVICCIGFFTAVQAQLPETRYLLQQINAATGKITEGRYILHNQFSSVSAGEDSSKRSSSIRCYFKPIPGDTLAGYKLTSLETTGYERVYDGNELLALTTWTKTLERTEANTYPAKIKALQHDSFIFPFFKYLNRLLQQYNTDSLIGQLKMTGMEEVNGEPCYRLQQAGRMNTEAAGFVSCYFISSVSLLPVRQLVKIFNTVGRVRTTQTFDYFMTDFQSRPVPDSFFTRVVLSEYSRVKEYNPADDAGTNKLLPAGETAPEWELPLLNGGKLKMSDLKGKIVIMDFWYKACTPCLRQMIDLEAFGKKLNRKDIVCIGINTHDDPEKDKLVPFLLNRDISMPIVLNGNTIEKLYHVFAEPALFVIDKNGKIIYTIDGYTYTLAEELSKAIGSTL